MNASTSTSFAPRHFPPAGLKDIPEEYILYQLRQLAPHYWNRPETTDCTIIVPVPQKAAAPDVDTPHLPSGTLGSARRAAVDALTSGRRVTESSLPSAPRIVMKLHTDYLSAQSTLFRGLFSGACSMDLLSSTSPTSTSSSFAHAALPSPSFAPRLISATDSHLSIFLPVPDPSSFRLIVHYLYFGQTDMLERSLAKGTVRWAGVARNAEYLGLRNDIKLFLGRYYGDVILGPVRRDRVLEERRQRRASVAAAAAVAVPPTSEEDEKAHAMLLEEEQGGLCLDEPLDSSSEDSDSEFSTTSSADEDEDMSDFESDWEGDVEMDALHRTRSS